MELRIAHLSRSFKDKKAVDDLSYTLTPGVYGLLGANGAGKTTLMRMLSAVLRPDSGRIWYNHGDIHELNEAYRSRLGYLPQHFGCYPGFTGRRFCTIWARSRGWNEIMSKNARNGCCRKSDWHRKQTARSARIPAG